MEDPLERAQFFHDEAERYRAIALITDSERSREIMLSIAEHFYLLHDDFVALSQPLRGDLVRLRP